MKKVCTIGLLSVLVAIAGEGCTKPSFAYWCKNKARLTPEARHTVEVILREVETENCDRAEDELAKRTQLNLRSHQIADVTPLGNLTHLTNLNLNSNQIEDVSSLDRLQNLTQLHLYDNQIEDVASLAHLTHLTGLYLGENQIRDVTPLASLTALRDLDLSDNPLSARVCPVQPETICEF